MTNKWEQQRYRQQQEDFVSNHGGTTSQEVLLVILPNICSIFLTSTIIPLLEQHMHKNLQLFLEFILIIIPCIVCCTILSEYVTFVCGLMLGLSILNILFIIKKRHISYSFKKTLHTNKIRFITNFRALANLMTATCILAVDFPVFPRKFAKTENFGYSLMDTGVGLFIVANALVSIEARSINIINENFNFHTILKNIKGCIPLLILGIGRALAIEYLGYQRHVSEYGIHWNFFITLAFVKLFIGLKQKTFGIRYSLLSGLWLLIMHEFALNTKGLKEWVLGPRPRDDFISANREGLISLPGYVGLYLISITIGKLIHSTYNIQMNTNNRNERWNLNIKIFRFNIQMEYTLSMVLCVKLSLIAAQACAVTLICNSYFGVSRRLVNFGYCAWILTLSSSILTLLLLIDIVMDVLNYVLIMKANVPKKRNIEKENRDKAINLAYSLGIFEAINYNGLFFFLLANILTGAVNMAVKTLYITKLNAIEILIIYMAVNVFIISFLYRFNVQLKL